MKFSLNSNGKINIGLNITGKREDGYHFLDMVMVPINLSDKISGEIEDISGKLTPKPRKGQHGQRWLSSWRGEHGATVKAD